MANKGSVVQGMLEKIVFKSLARLTFNTTNQLRVEASPATTFPVAMAQEGAITSVTKTQVESLLTFQSTLRRNITKT